MWLLALFIAVPLIEIALFIEVGGWLTLWPTLGIVLGSALLGTWLMRLEGARAMADLRKSLADLSDPSEPLAHGALILLAGALLITPGFLTDTIGLLLLIPPVRRWVMRYVARHANVDRVVVGQTTSYSRTARTDAHSHAPTDEDVIDGEFTELDPAKRPTHQPSGWTRH